MKKYLVGVVLFLTVGFVAFGRLSKPQHAKPTKRPFVSVHLTNNNGKIEISTPITFQNGLFGEYYDTQFLDGGVHFRRVDSTIDFSWPNGVPVDTTIIPDANYSERWTGYVWTQTPGNWTFITTSDDGIKLWIDGQMIISDWTNHAPREGSGSKDMTAGWHSIKIEHYNIWSPFGLGATMKLEYQGPNQARVIIPRLSFCIDPNGQQIIPKKTRIGLRNYSLKVISAKKL